MFGSVALYGDIPCPKPKRLETISAEMDFQIREYMALNLFFGLICQVRRPVTVSRESLDSGAAIRKERARRLKLGNLFATCQKEPQLVLFDRPSQRAVEVIDLVDRRLARHTAS